MYKPTLGVYKFTSCDGCQLAFLNAGVDLITLAELVNIVHFAEAGYANEDAKVDIAFVEGSVSTPQERERIKNIRDNCGYLITIGACATAGGIVSGAICSVAICSFCAGGNIPICASSIYSS